MRYAVTVVLLSVAAASYAAPTHVAVLDRNQVIIQSLADGSQRRIDVGVQFPGILPPCAFAAAGNNFAVNDFCGGGTVTLYSADGAVLREISAVGEVTRLQLSEDGQVVAAFSQEFDTFYVTLSYSGQPLGTRTEQVPGKPLTAWFVDSQTLACTTTRGGDLLLILLGPGGFLSDPIELPGEPEFGVGVLTSRGSVAPTPTPQPTATGEPVASPTAAATEHPSLRPAATGGCQVVQLTDISGCWMMPLLVGSAALLARKPRRWFLVALLTCVGEARAARPLFSTSATLRVDYETLQPLPRPNGPPQRTAGAAAALEGSACGVPDDPPETPSGFAVTPPPPGTYDIDLAVDVVNWEDGLPNVQQVINYLNAHYHAANAIFVRTAGIRLRIVHVHIWTGGAHPYGPGLEVSAVDEQWFSAWPQCPGTNCVDRDIV